MLHQKNNKLKIIIGSTSAIILLCGFVGISLLAPSRLETLPVARDAVTVNIDTTSPYVTSKLKVGATHTQESIVYDADPAAILQVKSLLRSGLDTQNQHIIGWGADNLWDDPKKDVSHWNWSSLDRRVSLMRDTTSSPILTLCCAPTWMVDDEWYPGKYSGNNTDWDQLEKAPLADHEDDWVYMIGKIAERYNGVNLDNDGKVFPKITRFQIWNEMKGFWNKALNRWDYEKYNRLYGLAYDTIHKIRPEAEVGGPYVRLSKWRNPSTVKKSMITSPDYGTIDKRDLAAVTQWLIWLDTNRDGNGRIKAQFLTVDGNLTVKDITDGTYPSNLWNATRFYADANAWLNNEMATILGTQLPIWWAEDYVGKVNGVPTAITAERYQPSLLATMLRQHVLSGTTTSLRWGPEEQLNDDGVRQGNKQDLYTSTQSADGGQPYENYTVYKYFHDHFSAGTVIYPAIVNSTTSNLSVIASSTKVLLINTSAETVSLSVLSGNGSSRHSVSAYEVKLVNMPST